MLKPWIPKVFFSINISVFHCEDRTYTSIFDVYRLQILTSVYVKLYLYLLVSDLKFFMGLLFDGYNKYANTRDYVLTVTPSPDIESWDHHDVMTYDAGDILTLKVKAHSDSN